VSNDIGWIGFGVALAGSFTSRLSGIKSQLGSNRNDADRSEED
jgi:hypothetical protein